MQHLTTAIEVFDHVTAILERSPFTALVVLCLMAFLVVGLGFGVIGYVVHKLR
jgi:hypothetical protein